jgi:proteic killer suppression protein
VVIKPKVQKQILKLPKFIQIKFQLWIFDVENIGLSEVQKIPGHHDEPLKGARKGQRSIRLNKAYRAIYEIKDDGDIEFILIIEVNKHDY